MPSRPGDPSAQRVMAPGASFSIKEWRGSGPAALHVHHADDEAWHILEGHLHFQFADREIDVAAGSTVFVPAGCVHTYQAREARDLLIFAPRLDAPIRETQASPDRRA